MPPTSIDSQIRDCAGSFADDIAELIKRSVLESVREVLGSDAALARPSPRLRSVTLTPEPAPYELRPVPSTDGVLTQADVPLRLDAYERMAILRALDENDGNVQAAADALGLPKSTMYRHLAEHGIPRTFGRDTSADAFSGYVKLDGPVSLEAYERAALERALSEANENLPDAAKLLGVGKSTMYRRCRGAGVR